MYLSKKPHRSVILCLVSKFYETESVLDDLKGKVGAKSSVRMEEVEDEARQLLKEDPCLSIAKLAQRLGASWSTTYHFVRNDIGLFPYKVQVLQKLTQFSKERRLKFVEEFTEVPTHRLGMLHEIWFSNECHFWCNGFVNKQNMELWSDKNPFEVEEAHLHPKKITVCAAFSSHGIIGSVFIRETVTFESCHTLLENDFIPELENRGRVKKAVFQQDGAKPVNGVR